jgi:hypothetical protein
VPRAPKFFEQPQDQEFGRIDQITLGGGTTFGISKLSIAIVVTLTCRADAYPVADYLYVEHEHHETKRTFSTMFSWFRMTTGSIADVSPVNQSDSRYFQHGGNLMVILVFK